MRQRRVVVPGVRQVLRAHPFTRAPVETARSTVPPEDQGIPSVAPSGKHGLLPVPGVPGVELRHIAFLQFAEIGHCLDRPAEIGVHAHPEDADAPLDQLFLHDAL